MATTPPSHATRIPTDTWLYLPRIIAATRSLRFAGRTHRTPEHRQFPRLNRRPLATNSLVLDAKQSDQIDKSPAAGKRQARTQASTLPSPNYRASYPVVIRDKLQKVERRIREGHTRDDHRREGNREAGNRSLRISQGLYRRLKAHGKYKARNQTKALFPLRLCHPRSSASTEEAMSTKQRGGDTGKPGVVFRNNMPTVALQKGYSASRQPRAHRS